MRPIVTTAPHPARVLIVGRSAAERSVLAAAFRRAGNDVVELSRASELGLPILKSAALVIALDQHAFIQNTLDEAQNYGILPLFLPVQLEGAEAVASVAPQASVRPNVDAALEGSDVVAASGPYAEAIAKIEQLRHSTDPTHTELQRQLASLVRSVAALPASEEADDATYLTLQEQAALDPFHDKPLPVWDDGGPDAADVRVQPLYDLKPEIDPANVDPSTLPELDSGGASPLKLIALVAVVGFAAAYLILAPEPPPTPAEQAALLAEQVRTTERLGLRGAEHLVYRARRIADERTQSAGAAPTICQRLLDAGRTEIAQEVCAQAHELNPAHTGSYARALIAGEVFDNADVILRLRLSDDPDDRSAWQAVAELARRKGDTAREREAIEALLRIEATLDPTEALRQRLEQLDADE